MPFEISLAGQTAIVTGGDKGIGHAIADALGKAGANLAIFYRSNDEAPKVAEELARAHGVVARAYRCDVTQCSAVRDAVRQVAQDFGGFHVVVANAGACEHRAALDFEEEQIDFIMDVNFKGVFFTCQAAARYWVEKKQKGAIVINASMSANIVNVPQQQCIYNASKAAVAHLGRSLAVEWAPHNIRVNTVSPGYIKTAMAAKEESMTKVWCDLTPMRRMGLPQEVGGIVLMLCSEVSSFMTGEEVIVDGGYSLQ